MKKFFPLGVALLSFVACNPDTKDHSNLRLVETGEVLQLPLDNETPNISDGIQYVDGDVPLLFNLNWFKNSLQIYDLKAKAQVKEIIFDQEGPEGVMEVFSFFVHSLDSIFLFNQRSSQIAIADTSGRVHSKIKYMAPDNYSPAFVHNTYFLSNPVLMGDEMLVKTHFHGNPREMTSEELASKEVLYGINLKTGATKFHGLRYPSNYLDKGFKSYELSIAISPEKYVLSFYGDHKVYHSGDLDQPLVANEISSGFIQGEVPVFQFNAEGASYNDYFHGSPHYESIVYDPYRKLFLRFAMHGVEVGDDVRGNELRNHSGPFSIQVLDKDLNLITEKAFAKDTYHPFNFFLTPEGIYLSINHPKNPSNLEDELQFELICYE
jgi:hypothetical protein